MSGATSKMGTSWRTRHCTDPGLGIGLAALQARMIRAKTAQKLPFCRVMASATPSTILFVANFPANTGYAWDFIESLFAGLATRLAPAGVRTLVAYPEIVSPPRTLLGTPAQPVLRAGHQQGPAS